MNAKSYIELTKNDFAEFTNYVYYIADYIMKRVQLNPYFVSYYLALAF